MLSLLLSRGQPAQAAKLVRSTLPLAIRVVVRWMVIIGFCWRLFRHQVLGGLLAARGAHLGGGDTGVLILVTVTLHELMRRLLYEPSMVRRVAFAGCNEVKPVSRPADWRRLPGMQVEGFFDDRSAERLGLAARRACWARCPTSCHS